MILCGANKKVAATAIANNWTHQQTEGYLKSINMKAKKMNNLRKVECGVRPGGGAEMSRQQILTAALAINMMLKPESVIKHIPGMTQQIVDRAMKSDYRNTTLKRVMCESSNSLGGKSDPYYFGPREITDTFRRCREFNRLSYQPGHRRIAMGSSFSTISAVEVFHAILQAISS